MSLSSHARVILASPASSPTWSRRSCTGHAPGRAPAQLVARVAQSEESDPFCSCSTSQRPHFNEMVMQNQYLRRSSPPGFTGSDWTDWLRQVACCHHPDPCSFDLNYRTRHPGYRTWIGSSTGTHDHAVDFETKHQQRSKT